MTAALPEEWIVATGLWPVHERVADVVVPEHVLADPDLSLIAKGLFTLLVAEQGKPVNPFDDAYEDVADIQGAVDELVDAGLAVRVAKP